jgi:hypothetical protein
MKVLLLHPEDELPSQLSQSWDLVVDLGRAPAATYEQQSKHAGCRIVSLADYAHGFEDIYRIKPTFAQGNGLVVDKFGIDWWDVLLPMLSTHLERSFMLVTLARELGDHVELYSSRPDSYVTALQRFLGIDRVTVVGESSSLTRRIQHYRTAFSRLDWNQLTQIAQDKFDSQHKLRKRLSRKFSGGGERFFLLPTAYINVSRTAVSYAELLPDEKFLLVVARPGGKLAPLPANVCMISLDPYFEPIDRSELAELMEKWETLKRRLVETVPEFRMAETLGIFEYGSQVMRWALAARDAWIRLFDSENIAGCLSADDVNPYTSLPIFIAARRNIPTLAVHHGALDYRMSMKPLTADFYLAKGDLEYDYLLETCRVDRGRVVMGGPSYVSPAPITSTKKSWLVFFTEPYGTAGWRIENVYEDLLPHLIALSRECGLDLVFKLHPFESIKGHKNLVQKFLSRDDFNRVRWIAGPTTPKLWNNVKFGMTVESTIALECAIRQIPIFLCTWLRSTYGGYPQQYAKFGVGHILNAPHEMKEVPRLLAGSKKCESAAAGHIWQTMKPAELQSLLSGNHRCGATTPAQAVCPAPTTAKQ